MSKSLQILLACIIAACLLLGYLVSLMLAPTPRGDPAAAFPDLPYAQRIRWPYPAPGPYRKVYAEQGRQIFFSKGCWQCHRLGNTLLPGEVNLVAIGPDLGDAGDRLTADEIVESIINPDAVIAGSREQNAINNRSKMPSAIDNLSVGDLVRLTMFLSEQHGDTGSGAAPDPQDSPLPVTPGVPAEPGAPAPLPAPIPPAPAEETPVPPPPQPGDARPADPGASPAPILPKTTETPQP